MGATSSIKRRNQHEKFQGILGKGASTGQNATEPITVGLNGFMTKGSTESIHGLSNQSGQAIRHATNSFQQNQQHLTRNKHHSNNAAAAAQQAHSVT